MEITQEILDTFYPDHQKGKLIQTCFDGFNIHEDDPLKEIYILIEEIFLKEKDNITYNRFSNSDSLKAMDIFQKTFIAIDNKLNLNPLAMLKASIIRFVYAIEKYLWNNNDLEKNLFMSRRFLIFLIERYDNLTDQESLELIKLLKLASIGISEIYDNYPYNKNNIYIYLEKLLREKGETEEVLSFLNYFFRYYKSSKEILSWYNNESLILKRDKDLYPIFDNDPYLEYQNKISECLENDFKLLLKEIDYLKPIKTYNLESNSENLEKLINQDSNNDFLKALILRYCFSRNYYNFGYTYHFRLKYHEILNKVKIKYISNDNLFEIIKIANMIESDYNHSYSENLLGFMKNLSKLLEECKNKGILDKNILSTLKNNILKYNSETLNAVFYNVLGFIFYPDNLGNLVLSFLEKNQTYTEQLEALFIQFYQLGKSDKYNKKKADLVYTKLKNLPDSLINSFFNEIFDVVLESKLIAKKEYYEKDEEDTEESNEENFYLVYDDFFSIGHENFFRGLLFLTPSINDKHLYNKMAKLCLKFYGKTPSNTTLNEKMGNDIVRILASVDDIYCLSLLSRLKYTVKHKKGMKHVIKTLENEANKRGIPAEEIEDFSIQDFGLKNGILSLKIGDNEASIVVSDYDKVEIVWKDKNGKTLKSPSSNVKTEFKTQLKEIKEQAKEIEKTLSIQKGRLDSFYLLSRDFTLSKWYELFINHELVKFAGQKFIWKFNTNNKEESGIFINDKIVNSQGNEIIGLNEKTIVSLWHPLDSSVEEVIEWRDFIISKEIRQPFKQAFREIYLLTDAEIKTKNYSNRFAAHIIKQHQFSSLGAIRGWSYQLMGCMDGMSTDGRAKKNLEKWNIRAEFWLNDVGIDEYNDSGMNIYVSTDQVRFISNESIMELKDVPKLVFSEIMRDVDLFVGVASIGNDPQWSDMGEEGFRNYWHSYSFGDLSETAKTRKVALERLLPRLKISNKCLLEGKFLKVKGNIRTYKIHLGSGNILMEPNDQYLCIVPDKKAKNVNEGLFIPFEEDNMFSIILSKAFLLANDTEIKDSSIISQIGKV